MSIGLSWIFVEAHIRPHVTDGDVLNGVRYWGEGASTESLVMWGKTGTIRKIEATQRRPKLMRYSAIRFDE
jgi:fructose-1,6-bisphosphatase II